MKRYYDSGDDEIFGTYYFHGISFVKTPENMIDQLMSAQLQRNTFCQIWEAWLFNNNDDITYDSDPLCKVIMP